LTIRLLKSESETNAATQIKTNHEKTLFLLFILNNLYSFGQNFTMNSKVLKSETIKIDTIQIQISVYEDKIVTESFLSKVSVN